MKPVKNRRIVRKSRSYYCKHCGTENSGSATFTEIVCGSATLTDIDGTLDDFETTDTQSDSMEVVEYRCDECARVGDLEELFTDEEPGNEDEDDEGSDEE